MNRPAVDTYSTPNCNLNAYYAALLSSLRLDFGNVDQLYAVTDE